MNELQIFLIFFCTGCCDISFNLAIKMSFLYASYGDSLKTLDKRIYLNHVKR